MKLHDVRKRYFDYMKSQGHVVLPSASLLPDGDTTTLFTGSGMQPLVPYLLGKEHKQGTRLADSQKCFRANDIEEVGDTRHTTFFEMLGNWSLGDYFKEEQLRQCFIFLTDTTLGLGLDPRRLYVTVFAGDESLGISRDEISAQIWKELFAEVGIVAEIVEIGSKEDGDARGMRGEERIFFYDADKNWWSRSGTPSEMPVGELGGPDSEVFYDFGEEHIDPAYAHLQSHPNTDSGRFIEICNSVFMEYIRTDDGFASLPKKNVDFGGGLERLTAVTIGTPDIFSIDIFAPLINFLEDISGVAYAKNPKPFRIIADHLRSAIFIAADGVVPSNTDRGYVLRRLIREGVHTLHFTLGVKQTTFASLCEHIVSPYRNEYKEIADKSIITCIETEERKFATTLEKGMRVFSDLVSKGSLTGEEVFVLYTTYGFPKELTVALATKQGVDVSLEDYTKAMKQHKDMSRASSAEKFSGGLADTSDESVRYHTATHLLYQALHDVLGSDAVQKGSHITPERLRFDFAHDGKLTDEQLAQVESIVNEKIRLELPITHAAMPIDEARAIGARGTSKYGAVVTVYSIGDYSKEFCGGPHVKNTKELGIFRIISEKSVSAGVRRIKAVLE